MALSTVLDIVNRAQDELSLPRSSAVATATDPQARQLFALLNSAGRSLLRAHEWGDLVTTGTLTTANGTSDYTFTTMSITDFDRILPDTSWDRTNHAYMYGPQTPQEDKWRRESGIASSATNKRFRILGRVNGVRIWPTPTATETLVFEYVSKNWARSILSVAQEEYQADTDTSVFVSNLLVKELKWRFVAAKGFAAEAAKMESDLLRDNLIAADIGGTILDMTAPPDGAPVSDPGITDGDWALT